MRTQRSELWGALFLLLWIAAAAGVGWGGGRSVAGDLFSFL